MVLRVLMLHKNHEMFEIMHVFDVLNVVLLYKLSRCRHLGISDSY